MSKDTLYRKYRSKSLKEIVGQPHITRMLSSALEQGRVAHAYLLTGPRGVGKTSIARILAHELNGLPYSEETPHLDIIEIDAASNNGVEDVRALREKVQIAPVSTKKKVYIIDEVHMLSKPAFNALLKTLEEPPEHIVFILATTDVEKLPATIISRTQRFHFRSISASDAAQHLQFIAKEEGITLSNDAAELIAQRGGGSFRDSISLLDQLASIADKKDGITSSLITEVLGLLPADQVADILAAVRSHDAKTVVALLQESEAAGVGTVQLTDQLLAAVKTSLAEHPEDATLMNDLLSVAASPLPSLKLLSVLVQAATPVHPKTAALQVATKEVSAPIADLAHKATQPHPSDMATNSTPQPKPAKKTPVAAPAEKPEAPATTATKTAAVKAPDTFDWDAFLTHAKTHFIALASVLAKCHHERSGDTITVYTGNAFYKKKLDDARYSAHLYECLEKTNQAGFTIETIAAKPPIKDSKAAAVAAIMGGGEEVSLV